MHQVGRDRSLACGVWRAVCGWLLTGCTMATDPMLPHSAANGPSSPSTTGVQAGNVAATPWPSDAGALHPVPTAAAHPMSTPAGASNSATDCPAGMYTGNYDVGLLGSGPVQFVLVENDMPAPSGVPCSEFCSDLVTGTSGGDLSLSWYGFVGSAKLKGGLDCRTGEFRAELVDGEYALLPGDPDASAQLLPPGELAGQLAGKLQGQAPVAITGTLHVRAALESDGTFTVQHAP